MLSGATCDRFAVLVRLPFYIREDKMRPRKRGWRPAATALKRARRSGLLHPGRRPAQRERSPTAPFGNFRGECFLDIRQRLACPEHDRISIIACDRLLHVSDRLGGMSGAQIRHNLWATIVARTGFIQTYW